jgi:RNA polymerase sigma factor (sigma-70 family)
MRLAGPAADTAWLETWIESYGDKLVRFGFAHSGDWQLAQDVAQETFLRLYQWHRRHPHREIAPAWCYQVAYHLLMDDHRRRVREEKMVPDQGSPGDATEEVVDRAAVLGALDSLSSSDRQCLWLFYYEGWSTDQIGRSLGLQPAAVRTRLMRARDRFRAAYLGGRRGQAQPGRF